MKILWVKPGKLLPLDSGGKLRTYNILRHLCENQDVTFLSYYSGSRNHEYELEIEQHFPGTICIQTELSSGKGFSRYIDYVRRLPDPVPYSVSHFTSTRVQRLLAEWISQRIFDVAVCDFLASAPNFPEDLAIATVLFQHNVESSLWKRRARYEQNWLDRLLARIEYAKMARFEPGQVRRFHRVFAVSDQDRCAIGEMVDPELVSVIPTGVDLEKFYYDREVRATEPLVVFAGSMDWQPNIDAVEYFCRDIWPIVVRRVPGAQFRIVGRDPHARIRKLASAAIRVTGTVDSIVDHLRDAAVLVVPLRMGGGTRIKIYEGMAMGKATVSTTVGAEGLDVRHGHDILLADEPGEFANCVVTLLSDQKLRRKYETAAATTAAQYDWSVIADRFSDELRRTMGSAVPNPVSSQIVTESVLAKGGHEDTRP